MNTVYTYTLEVRFLYPNYPLDYIGSTFTLERLPYFRIIDYQQLGKNQFLVKSIKFIRPNVLSHKKGVCTFCDCMTMVIGLMTSPSSKSPTTPLILLTP